MCLRDLLSNEQVAELKALAKQTIPKNPVVVTRKHGTTTHDGNVPFIKSRRVVLIPDVNFPHEMNKIGVVRISHA
tara:strand:+ start:200 stop:424 length:225 start_codon:yes stop_codon:yes gene_type:complete